jgi:hypothetical protein
MRNSSYCTNGPRVVRGKINPQTQALADECAVSAHRDGEDNKARFGISLQIFVQAIYMDAVLPQRSCELMLYLHLSSRRYFERAGYERADTDHAGTAYEIGSLFCLPTLQRAEQERS